MARTRTTKKLAQRIDLNYFKRPTPLKRAKFWLSLLLPLLALLWITEGTIFKDSRVYSSGRLSEPHAVLEKECATCHTQQAGMFSAKAGDNACLSCHDGPTHHEAASKKLECAACHTEHRGRINIAAASNQSCAECHADLRVSKGTTEYAKNIRSFEKGHPEFAALRIDGPTSGRDLGTIKLNHGIHMKPIRRGPTGPIVNLECGNCHRPIADQTVLMEYDARYAKPLMNWPYADHVSAKTTYAAPEDVASDPWDLLHPSHSRERERMAPVKFAKACADCHSLAFDKRFREGVPHDQPEVIHDFVVSKFRDYIHAHPEELRVQRDPDRDISGKPMQPPVRVFTPAQWVAERTAEAEFLLWRKTCVQCHTLGKWSPRAIEAKHHIPYPPMTLDDLRHFVETFNRPELFLEPIYAQIPQIWPAGVTLRWMPHAKFDHEAHRPFSCVSCHAKALTSTETSDILLPGIETCKTCHAPGPEHAESRCFECHTYHDWSKRKEVTPTFTLPALRTGGH
ncbi:MAG TPA: hypothetical protein VGR03_13580 [Candidatus Acidoferrum sp.]|nr:hypothetical protein [Candidatus Acidoferrum sp.]